MENWIQLDLWKSGERSAGRRVEEKLRAVGVDVELATPPTSNA